MVRLAGLKMAALSSILPHKELVGFPGDIHITQLLQRNSRTEKKSVKTLAMEMNVSEY
jgi:hypothetical protein